VAVLVDYDASNTNLKSREILSMLKEEMQNNLNPADSFNLIVVESEYHQAQRQMGSGHPPEH
jgi:hypothetical protein